MSDEQQQANSENDEQPAQTTDEEFVHTYITNKKTWF